MIRIAHRVNTAARLQELPPDLGVEIDLRQESGRLILQHDAFAPGEDFEAWLAHYRHALLILNVKCDGMEDAILSLLTARGIGSYFFLDQPIPTLVRRARQGAKAMAVRFSEYEPVEAALRFAGLAEWVWVDCFRELPLDRAAYDLLKPRFRICLVSPELQGHSPDRIAEFKARIRDMDIDAVCTKHPQLW